MRTRTASLGPVAAPPTHGSEVEQGVEARRSARVGPATDRTASSTPGMNERRS